MTRVAVARNKFAKGFKPGQENVKDAYEVRELRNALERVYTTDAHLVMYLVEGLGKQPRINKPGLDLYGKRLTVECFFCDLDNPGHALWTDVGFAASREVDLSLPILATAGVYYTKRGRRIVQPLAEPLEIADVEANLRFWLTRLSDAGLRVDWGCSDWTRHFRLPNVPREHKGRARCLDLSRMESIELPPLPAEPAEQQVLEKPRRRAPSGPRAPSVVFAATVPEQWRSLVESVATEVARIGSPWHPLFLALAGSMLQLGIAPELVPALNRAISSRTHADDRVEDRVQCAHTTIARWRARDPFVGLRALEEQWPGVARAMRRCIEDMRFERVVSAAPTAPPVVRTLDETLAALEAAIENAPPGLTLIKAECGLGKTQAALRIAARRAAKPYANPKAAGLRAPPNSKTSLSVDKNKLAIQCVGELEKLGHSAVRVFGPLSLMDADGFPECKLHEVASPLVEGGQRMQWELCERRGNDPKCPHYDNCRARDGEEGNSSNRITIGSHALLGELNARAGSTGLLVIDEVQDYLETVELSESDFELALRSGPVSFDGMFVGALAPALWAFLAFLRSAPEGEPVDACEAVLSNESAVLLAVWQQGQRSALLNPDADVLACAIAAPFPERHHGTAPPIQKTAIDFALYQPSKAKDLGRISKVLETVHHALSSEYPTSVRVEQRRQKRLLLVTSPREMLARALRRDGAVVVTDANVDLHAPILAKVVGYEPPMHLFTAPDGAPIERTMLRTKKATRKAWFRDGRLEPASPLSKLFEAAIRWIRHDPNCRTVGIISVPLVEVAIRFAAGLDAEECRQRWKSLGQPSSALDRLCDVFAPVFASWQGTLLTAHYGATRGLNDMGEADALITLGDPWMNLGDARSDAAFLQLAADWESRYEARCRAELEQAHGRLRTVHRKLPGRALHIGAVMPGGSGWTKDRVVIHELDLVEPSTSDDRSRLEVLVRRVGSMAAVARLLGCSASTVVRFAKGEHRSSGIATRIDEALERTESST